MSSLPLQLALCLLACSVSGAYFSSGQALDVFEQLPAIPDGWALVGLPDPDVLIQFRVALKPPNLAAFERTVLDVSTPGHRKYGRHLTTDQMKAMLRPTDGATEAVLKWLDSTGVSGAENDGDWITYVTKVKEAEQMMNTTFFRFRDLDSQAEIIRTLRYSIPSALHPYIDMIQPTTRFGRIQPQRSTIHDVQVLSDLLPSIKPAANSQRVRGTNCNSSITPACLTKLYDVGDFTADPNNGNKLGVTGFLEQYAKQVDLDLFVAKYVPSAENATFTFASVNGGLNTQEDDGNDSTEANLDIQYALGVSYPVPNIYYSTPGRGPLVPDLQQPNRTVNSNEPYLEFLIYMVTLPDDELPQTLSTSYGENEQSLPKSYMRVVCRLFAQLGARGVSVLFSSGNDGPGGICLTNDGRRATRFQPGFPASCPWVTAVGGTVGINPERAVSFSSGGFSDVFPRPEWQKDAVNKYLEKVGDPFPGLYNRLGRGIPDVAAQAVNFRIFDKGRELMVGGTSAAAPTFAAIIALLNSARLSAGQAPLGYLNPWLYGAAREGLTDITEGGSTGCAARTVLGVDVPGVPGAGWNAMEGWDPVTGLGTPKFSKLLNLMMGRPGV